MSSPEMNLLGSDNARKTGQYYFLVSPAYFNYLNDGDHVRFVNPYGSWTSSMSIGAIGVRPAVSLISGIGYSSVDGSMADPYVVDTSGN